MSKHREPNWPDGWHWSSEHRSVAHGPKGAIDQAVWIHSKERGSRSKPPHVEFSVGMDSAPAAVVESVIRRAREYEQWDKTRGPVEPDEARTAREFTATHEGMAAMAFSLGRDRLSAMLGILPDAPPVLHAMSKRRLIETARMGAERREAEGRSFNYGDGFTDAVGGLRSWIAQMELHYGEIRERLARLDSLRSRLNLPLADVERLATREPGDGPGDDVVGSGHGD
jgi:hypothetical protein